MRAATAVRHRAVESLPALTRLFDPGLDRPAYSATLRGLLRATVACERALRKQKAQWAGRGLDWGARLRKSQWLHEDLARLGVSPEPPPLPASPELDDISCCVGCLYVLEGATLGGCVIGKALRRNARIPVQAQRYFTGYGADTGARWTAFWLRIGAAHAWEAPARAAAAETARATFDLYHACLADAAP
ncbi:biliverdin-producing heme oxygenase [Ectothiorhodospiraceae bacterium 2226]|nr:biliverdin-producing heme oxygenase [Ectothiorhodospiraceae bacterium 2226]